MSNDTKKTEELESMQPYAHWLNSVDGVGKKTIDLLLGEFKTVKAVYEAQPDQLKILQDMI